MKWKTEPQAYGPAREALYLGAYCVATVSYDITTARGDDRKHAAYIFLPGHKKEATRFESAAKAKEAIETAVTLWIERAGLQPMRGDGA